MTRNIDPIPFRNGAHTRECCMRHPRAAPYWAGRARPAFRKPGRAPERDWSWRVNWAWSVCLCDWRVRGLQPFEHGRGRHDARGTVPFQGKQTLVSGDEKRGLAGGGERQQEAVLGVPRCAGRRRLGVAEGQVVKGRGKKLGIASAILPGRKAAPGLRGVPRGAHRR